MKRTKQNTPQNPYANNRGGQIRAPHSGKENEPKGTKIVGKDDLRSKK